MVDRNLLEPDEPRKNADDPINQLDAVNKLALGPLYAPRDPNMPGGAGAGLPESIVPQRTTGALKSAIGQQQAGVLSPETTARAARNTSPEGQAYAAQLEQQRSLWGDVQLRQNQYDYQLERMREPGITDQGLFKRQQRVSQAQQRLDAAKSAAEAGGVDHTGPFPSDLRITAPHGSFPGDDQYARASFAPDWWPFYPLGGEETPHQFHDPSNWLPGQDQ